MPFEQINVYIIYKQIYLNRLIERFDNLKIVFSSCDRVLGSVGGSRSVVGSFQEVVHLQRIDIAGAQANEMSESSAVNASLLPPNLKPGRQSVKPLRFIYLPQKVNKQRKKTILCGAANPKIHTALSSWLMDS